MKSKSHLTPREKEVISLAAQGKSYEEIAKKLDIGYETVSSHFKNARVKLNAINTVQTVAIAVAQNLLLA